MGNFGHRQITITSTSHPIAPEDFKGNLHRAEAWGKHSEWNEGPMRHVIDALAGTEVVIVIEKRTGFTLVGATLVDVRRKMSGASGIAVSTPDCKNAQNPEGITVYSLRAVGVIIPLRSTTHGQRGEARQAEEREMELAERIYTETLPEDRPEGHVEVSSFSNELHVGYRRTNYADRRSTPRWSRVSLAQVRAASLCATCLKAHEGQSHQYKCPTFQVEMDARLEVERQRREAEAARFAKHGF
jgi:hypothetical protein